MLLQNLKNTQTINYSPHTQGTSVKIYLDLVSENIRQKARVIGAENKLPKLRRERVFNVFLLVQRAFSQIKSQNIEAEWK